MASRTRSSSSVLRRLKARGRGDGVPADATPSTFSTHRYKKLTKLVVTLNNHPKIKEWNAAKNPKLPWYEPEN